jgi:anti-sigma B factor antagonist
VEGRIIMADTDQITVNTTALADGILVRPTGDIDLSCSPALRQHLAAAQLDKPRRLVIDLSEVPYMDSSGIATLLEAMQIARRNGTRLVLCGLREKVRSIIEITRLDSVFTIAADPSAASTA